MNVRQRSNSAFLYDAVTADIVGVRDPDGSEFFWMRAPHVGWFYDIEDQSDGANTATAMLFRQTDVSRGISIVDGSKITVSRSGVYNIQFSAMFSNPEATAYAVSFWLKKNGENVASTNTDLTVPTKHGSVNGKALASMNFFVEAQAQDYFQIMWSTPMNTVFIEHIDEQANPARPATPSIILTVNEVALPS